MKKRVLSILLTGIIIFSMAGCSFKIKPNTNVQDIEGDINIVISTNLMNELFNLGNNYEFIPLEYSSGIVRGIISPTKIEKYTFESHYENRGLNPLRYTEYTMNAFNSNSFVEETGEVLGLNEIIPYVLNVENPKNIILKDNKKKATKNYVSKISEDFAVNESVAYNSNGGSFKVNDIQKIDGGTIYFSYSPSKIVGKYNRYVYSSFGYSEELDENGVGQDYKNIIVLYDSKTESFYESEIINGNYDFYENAIFEVNNEIYFFKPNGKINKIVLENGKVLFEEYYDLELSENEALMISYSYTNNYVGVDNIFVNIGNRSSKGGVSYTGESVLNIKNKSIINLPQGEDYINIHKIFSNSDNLVMVSKRNNISNKIWIAKYEDGEFEYLVPIDKIHPNNASIYTENIEDILYDNETNSFFIKRIVTIDKKQGYQYEILKL